MQPIRFAIIGCGHIAQRHAQHANHYGVLVAVCDVIRNKAESLVASCQTNQQENKQINDQSTNQYNNHLVIIYEEIDALLLDDLALDLIVICTPNGLHSLHSIKALNAGYHVLVEKPMAIKTADCLLMMEAATRADKRIFTVKQNRFNPPVVALKKEIDAGALGKIFSIQISCFWNRPAAYYKHSWHGSADLDGGILFTQFSHFIDLLYWLFGDVKSVQAIAENFSHQGMISNEDCGAVLMKLNSGAIVTLNYSVNSYRKNAEGSITVLAEKGTVKIGGEYLNTIAYQEMENGPLEISGEDKGANQYGAYQGSMSNHGAVYESLVNALQKNTEYYATAFEAMKTVEIIERIYQSLF